MLKHRQFFMIHPVAVNTEANNCESGGKDENKQTNSPKDQKQSREEDDVSTSSTQVEVCVKRTNGMKSVTSVTSPEDITPAQLNQTTNNYDVPPNKHHPVGKEEDGRTTEGEQIAATDPESS